MKRRPVLAVVAAMALPFATISASSCATAKAAQGAAANMLLPVSEENKLGQQMAKEIEKELKVHKDPEVQRYIQQLGNRIASKAKDKPEGIKFTFTVIDDDKTINAFAIPGGHIYVFSGLMKAAGDESELAGVIGHEIAHVTQRHIAERLVTQLGLQTVLSLALGKNPGMLAQLGAQVAATGGFMKFTRDQESEADTYGLNYLVRSGYDPNGMVRFFQKLQKSEGPGFMVFLQSHPLPSDRIKALKTKISRIKSKPSNRGNTDTYRDIKEKA